MEVPYFQVPNDIFEIDLDKHELLVYMYLARCGNQGSTSFPSYNKIAEKTGMSRRKAIDSVKSLEEKNLLVKEKRYNYERQENYSNIYRVEHDVKSISGAHNALGSEYSALCGEEGAPYKEIDYKEPDYKELKGYKGSDKSPRCIFSFDILDKQIEKIMNSISNNGVIGNLDTNDIKEFFRMYYDIGKHMRNIKPNKLKNEQIEKIIDCISYIDEVDYNPSLDDYKKILIDYFNQDFPNCDYSINHFVSGDVLLMRYYNLRPLLE